MLALRPPHAHDAIMSNVNATRVCAVMLPVSLTFLDQAPWKAPPPKKRTHPARPMRPGAPRRAPRAPLRPRAGLRNRHHGRGCRTSHRARAPTAIAAGPRRPPGPGRALRTPPCLGFAPCTPRRWRPRPSWRSQPPIDSYNSYNSYNS